MKTSTRRRTLITLLATLSFVFAPLCGFPGVRGAAQSEQAERMLEDKVPTHVPVKVRVKNLQNKNWARDLEVEVKNTGGKPIYFAEFVLLLPETESGGAMPMGFRFAYGREEMVDVAVRALPADLPLRPGETHTFKIEEKFVKGWEQHRARHNVPEPRRFLLKVTSVNFGDGTGLSGAGGAPVSVGSATSAPCAPGQPVVGGGGARAQSPPADFEAGAGGLPVRFLPAFFLPVGSKGGGPRPAARQGCCDDYNCDKLKEVANGYNCECGTARSVVSVSCRESGGSCGKLAGYQRSCYGDYGYVYYCTDFYVNPCGGWDSI